ncbi:serine/threonine-protein kinase LMTK1 isoform X1 [Electrophorus electricus]|uniref:serine/threonine-protein kinase LMTK1 isoform X1 n=3 Tax=Electrophorus electricus TaxID=8005 RepID=UPI0015D06AE9|nr:serine/threonine-protein kinase LMTK1 isoform X1 [Electrophorus electricus]
MSAALVLTIMSASYFNPSFALSSHFDSDGAPLSELSWSSSLAVVAVSFSGLFTFVFLMLACLCCKKGEIGFKEFENAEGDEYQVNMSTLASPASGSSTDVYVLPLTEVSLPVAKQPLTEVSLPVAKQPARSVQLLKSTETCRHSLMCIKEIGHGWFGKVLLGELNSGLSSTQVVVKELKAGTSVHDQMRFLEEARPYRSLQHSALVQCLAQCTEVSPYLLIMELCPLGDVKGYLRSCRVADSVTPDPLLLQRMACQIASGLLHLHKHNYTHSDLALRNCLLTSDLTVKIGDYGLSQSKYKDDYFVTSDQSWVPLRWIAPEMVNEVHGNLLVVDQTKQSNIWSLGVTIWELFELGNQPYRHYSDRQVLSYAVKDQQLKLPKPLLQFPLADRWYEVMQFCWLQPDQRPSAEEVHLLLSYLCAKGASEAEEDFERRWNSMRPNMNHSSLHGAGPLALNMPQTSTTSSSFPLLEQFSTGDGYQSGDDILTVTETSHGLNFEYKWEQARVKQPYHSSTGTLGQGNPHCQEIYYPPGGMVGGCGISGMTLGVSPQYYEAKHLHTPGVVPVLNAHSTSMSSEYYIRIEEPVDCSVDLEYPMCAYSPDFGGSSGSFLTASGDSGECINCPSEGKPIDSYWSADMHKNSAYDSDSSPALSLTMEPLLGQVSDASPLRPWESGHYVSYKDRDGGYYYEPSPPMGMERYLFGDPSEPQRESWGSRSLRQALGELEDPLGISPSLGSPPRGFRDPYIESSQGSVIGKNVTGGYYDMMGSLRKTMPGNHSICIDMESGGALFVGQDDSDSEEEDLLVDRQAMDWASNHSTKNTLSLSRRQALTRQDAYTDFHYTMPMTDVEDAWPKEHSLPYRSAKQLNYLEAAAKSNTCPVHGRHAPVSSVDCNSHSHLCHEPREAEVYPVPCCQALSNSHFVDPLTGSLVRNSFMNDNVSEKNTGLPNRDQQVNQPALSTGHVTAKTETTKNNVKQKEHPECVDFAVKEEIPRQESSIQDDTGQLDPQTEAVTMTQQLEKPLTEHTSTEPESEISRAVDSGVDNGQSSISLVEIDDCSDEDITDVTSGIFGDFPGDYNETVDYTNPTFKSLQKQVGTPDSMESIDLPSTVSSSETFSPASIHPSSSSRAMDSGYDTENNESPEFVPKEPHEPQDAKAFIKPLEASISDPLPLTEARDQDGAMVDPPQEDREVAVALTTTQNNDEGLTALSEKTPYRDSAYFSDCDTAKEKESEEHNEKDTDNLEKQREKSIEIIDKEELLTIQIVEQDNEMPHVGATNENGECIHNNTEEQAENLLLEEDEIVCVSTPEVNVIPPSSAEMAECPVNKDEDELDSGRNQEELPSESQSSDLTALPFSDATKETSEPEETESILSLEPLTTVSADIDVETILDAFNNPDEPQTEEEVTEKETSMTCLKEPTSQDGTDVMPTANTARVSIDTLADKSETPDGNTKGSTRPFSPPPLPPPEGRASPADGQEADEEDGDSEDSDESDEELRTYRIQEQSEESDDEVLAVPIVVSDCSQAHKLRSLLKIPSLLPDSLCDDLESKKKVVSFFDDVTVYLFDQESPTRELAEHGLPLGEEADSQSTKISAPDQQERVNASDDSSDGNISEESAAFEWEDDFTLLQLPTSVKGSPPDVRAEPTLPPSVADSKPAGQFSRFTVSPSTISRFSITHVSDSDIDSAGGSSEDGEKE